MKRVFCFLLSLVFCLSFVSCTKQQKYFKKEFYDLFDTVCSITAADTSQDEFNEHFKTVYNELKTYSDLLSIYTDSKNNLKYINEKSFYHPVTVDKKITDLLSYGKKIYSDTNGTVNIAMGSVLSLWHDKREEGKELPKLNQLKKLSHHTNIDDLIINGSTVELNDKEMSLDVGSVAKGYVCEKIAQFITDNGIWNSAVISLGGNVKTIGKKNNSFFKIGLENPNGSDYLGVVRVMNGKSVVTSGNYQRYYVVNGKKYCHIIDPDTLMPADYFSSVTVIGEDSLYCDEMSTYLFCLPVEEGMKIVNSDSNIEAMWCDKNGKLTYSDRFEDYLIEQH